MDAHEFIIEFGKNNILPIDLDEHVIPALVKAGITDEIYPFYDSNLPEGTLSGHFVHEKIPRNDRGDFYMMATITYGPGTNELQRLVACKEVMHLFDPHHCQVTKPEEVQDLMEKMILPKDLVDPIADGDKALTDRMAVLQSVAILFPITARDTLLPLYRSKKIDLDKITELAELPKSIVVMVMSETWPKTLSDLLTWLKDKHTAKS